MPPLNWKYVFPKWLTVTILLGLFIAVSGFWKLTQYAIAEVDALQTVNEGGYLVQKPKKVTLDTGVECAKVSIAERVSGRSYLCIVTTVGVFAVELFDKDAPKTVEAFKNLSAKGLYVGTKFHRVIRGFMIQGGDLLSKEDDRESEWGTGNPGYTLPDEFNSNKLLKGTLAMANVGRPDTNGSQFFIITATNGVPWLEGKHTPFGKVVFGIEVVEAIEKARVVKNPLIPGELSKPEKPVEITGIQELP
jgi:peptidyl-prolyl cis-trans isomerase B (cyclophilin B)